MSTLWKNYIQNINPPTLRLFKDFLISHHIYNQYHHNFISQEAIRWRFKQKNRPCPDNVNLIINAFLWRTTPQGHDKWLFFFTSMGGRTISQQI